MELQLGLGLGLGLNPIGKGFGFDLNGYGCKPRGVLGSDPSSHVGSCWSSDQNNIGDELISLKKRGFDEAFGERQGKYCVVPKTLALLVWDDMPKEEEEDDHTHELDKNSSTTNKSDEEEDGVVGWPPIKSWRKKNCHQNRSSGTGNERLADNYHGGGGAGGGGGSKSTYVKVKMEGVAIARKVDLSLHQSYQSLINTLVGMFGSGEENVEAYKLTYQDKEGDWLLAGDLPWSSFIQSVQRLKLVRSSD